MNIINNLDNYNKYLDNIQQLPEYFSELDECQIIIYINLIKKIEQSEQKPPKMIRH